MTFHFELEFIRRTHQRQRNQRGRLFMSIVALQIHRINEDTYRLTFIETIPLLRQHGYASIAMDWLCRLADDYGMKLELCPVQLDKAGLDLVSLTAWYQRFGFLRIGLQDEMTRYPNRQLIERRPPYEKKIPHLVQ